MDLIKDEKTGKTMLYINPRVNHIVDGLMYQFRDDGSLEAICNLSNGKKHGVQKFFYKNGDIQQIENWNDGLIVGNQYTFFENQQQGINIIKNCSIWDISGQQSDTIYSQEGRIENAWARINGEIRVIYRDGIQI